MKRLLFLLSAFTFCLASLAAQDAKALYQSKFSYDLKQDKVHIDFDGKTFWLRGSIQKDDTLTLVFSLKGETPQTATESLLVQLPSAKETVDSYTQKLVEGVRAKTPIPPDVTVFKDFPGGAQNIITFVTEDRSNNLVEDSQFKLTQLEGKRLMVAAHVRRLKLSAVAANPDLATTEIGDHRDAWMLALSALSFPF